MSVIDNMKKRLREELHATYVVIKDDSDKHKGHAHGGGGHYRLTVVSAAFEGLNAIKRHQKVYSLFEDQISHEIHALSIKALTPQEAQGMVLGEA